jgi:hypothetical protein
MSFFEMPSKAEWNNIETTKWPSVLEELDDLFAYDIHPENSPQKFAARLAMTSWEIDLMNRLRHTRWTYVFITHIYGKGIPDDEWIRSPAPGEIATKYFPSFEHEHHIRKATFDYFIDIFFFKLYSCLDTLGHVLINMYDIELKGKPNFHRAVDGLKIIRPSLHAKLTLVIESDDFKEIKSLRHVATHNEALGGVNSFVNKISPNHFTFGAGKYITSSEIIRSVENAKVVLERIFKLMLEQVAIDK